MTFAWKGASEVWGAPCSKGCSRGGGTWQSAQGLKVADETALLSKLYQHRPRRGGAPPNATAASVSISIYLEQRRRKMGFSQ
jgi:hypothetical protein